MSLLPRFNDSQVQDAIRRLREEEERKRFPRTTGVAFDASAAAPSYSDGPKFEPEHTALANADEIRRQPKFEPEQKGPDMTAYNAANPLPPPAPKTPDMSAYNAANPAPPAPGPTFTVPPEPSATAGLAQFDEENTPIPVFDKHGAPTGEMHGGGTELEKRRAAVDAERNYKPENHNSRLKSAAIGGGRGLLQGGLLGALFGLISHAADPSQDEKYAHRHRLFEAQGEYKGAATEAKDQSELASESTTRLKQIADANLAANKERDEVSTKERADALKNLQQYEKLDPANPTHVAAITRARKSRWDVDPETWNAGNVQTVFDQDSGVQMQRPRGSDQWEPSRDKQGNPITTKQQKPDKLPDSFYKLDGQDEKTITADAVSRAGLKDFSAKAEIDPAKKALMMEQLGLSEADLKDGIQLGTIKLSELVKDNQRDEARRYDAAVAGAESGALKRMNLYRQAVDQTQTAPQTAPVVSIATFQQKYKEFYDAYNTLYKKDPKAADQKRAEFFNTLRNFRLR